VKMSVKSLSQVRQVSTGNNHTVCCIMCDRGSPVKMSVKSLSQVRQVSTGNNHTVLLTTDGHVLTCGSNQVSNNCLLCQCHCQT